MIGNFIIVLTSQRQSQRQIARALRASGTDVRFVRSSQDIRLAMRERRPDLVILDCDSDDAVVAESTLLMIASDASPPPIILLSTGPDKASLLALVQRHDISNLVAKHGAIRAVYPMLDERELLVTCEKVLRKDIFGIDKYIGSWGIVLRRETIRTMAEKTPFLTRFEQFLTELDCPGPVVPEIVTSADELVMNAAVHAPRRPDGSPKYEAGGARSDLVLEDNERIDVVFGCDGQHLMLSVSDNFGRLSKVTLYNYLLRGFQQQIEVETKPGGAGLGLSYAARSIHQLIFNIQDTVRTEAIAGWYLRVPNAREFGQVGKSLNVFWLPADHR